MNVKHVDSWKWHLETESWLLKTSPWGIMLTVVIALWNSIFHPGNDSKTACGILKMTLSNSKMTFKMTLRQHNDSWIWLFETACWVWKITLCDRMLILETDSLKYHADNLTLWISMLTLKMTPSKCLLHSLEFFIPDHRVINRNVFLLLSLSSWFIVIQNNCVWSSPGRDVQPQLGFRSWMSSILYWYPSSKSSDDA